MDKFKKEIKCENCKNCNAEVFFNLGTIFPDPVTAQALNKVGVGFRALCKKCYCILFGAYEGDPSFCWEEKKKIDKEGERIVEKCTGIVKYLGFDPCRRKNGIYLLFFEDEDSCIVERFYRLDKDGSLRCTTIRRECSV